MLWRALDKYTDLGLLIARLGFGLGFFWYHGRPKLTGGRQRWEGTGGAMESLGIRFGAEWWGLAAGIAEGIGGLLIAAGLFFRPAALAIAFVMFVATINHWVTGRGTPAHSFKNAWVLAGLFFIGPGKYSVDHWWANRKKAVG